MAAEALNLPPLNLQVNLPLLTSQIPEDTTQDGGLSDRDECGSHPLIGHPTMYY